MSSNSDEQQLGNLPKPNFEPHVSVGFADWENDYEGDSGSREEAELLLVVRGWGRPE